MNRTIKVLVVDDSALVRQTMTDILNSDPELTVIATAADPYIAVKRIRDQEPDVITLDVEMPKMDGITFLRKLMSQHPIPVVMCSSLTGAGCDLSMQALALGAVDIISKPQLGIKAFLEESHTHICDTVKAAGHAKVKRLSTHIHVPERKMTADAVLEKPHETTHLKTTEKVVVIGASTGGTEALHRILTVLPPDSPGIVVVQHMPAKFTAAFASHLNTVCQVTVKEAEDGDSIVRSRVLVAPGGRHTLVKRKGAQYYVEVQDGPSVNRHKPSVDVLFRSTARYAGQNAIGVILSGMGDDGAAGMQEMHSTGALTIAQDEQTCVVYGMPKEAIALGGVDHILPLSEIAGMISQMSKR